MGTMQKQIDSAGFVAGTVIHTRHGPLAVEQFVGGEQVLARNEKTHEIAYCGVLGTIAAEEQAIYRVVIGNGIGNTETLRTTAEHPFWIKDEGWKKASLLMAGDLLLDLDSKVLTVLEAEPQGLFENVYNIEVAEFHTYHAGNFGVWVHNVTGRYYLRSSLTSNSAGSGDEEKKEEEKEEKKNYIDRFVNEDGTVKAKSKENNKVSNSPEVPESCIESAEFIIQVTQNTDLIYQEGKASYEKGTKPVYALFGKKIFINISDTKNFHNLAAGLTDYPDLKSKLPGIGEGIALIKSTEGDGDFNMHFGAVLAIVARSIVISDMSDVGNPEALVSLSTKQISSADKFRGEPDDDGYYSEDDFAMGLLTLHRPGDDWDELPLSKTASTKKSKKK